ncbi:MAG: chalcone isomerase family protein [Tahibacter sp.]
MRSLWIPKILLALAFGNASAVIVGGTDFPEHASVPGVGNNLHLSGAAVLDRNFVPFYVGALYVPLSVRTSDQLLSGLSPCRFNLVWMSPALDKDRVKEYWRKAFNDAAGPEQARRLTAQLDRLLAVFNGATHGQVVLFDYIPDAGMRIYVDDRPAGQLPGVEFNRILLSIWLGTTAPRDFRTALLANLDGK